MNRMKFFDINENEKTIIQCDYCGKWYELDKNGYPRPGFVDGRDSQGVYHPFCDIECAEAAGYDMCEQCGYWYPKELVTILGGNHTCNNCLSDMESQNMIVTCEHCGKKIYKYDKEYDNVQEGVDENGVIHTFCSITCCSKHKYTQWCEDEGVWELEKENTSSEIDDLVMEILNTIKNYYRKD